MFFLIFQVNMASLIICANLDVYLSFNSTLQCHSISNSAILLSIFVSMHSHMAI